MACVEKTNPIVKRPSRLVKGFSPNMSPVINSLSTYSLKSTNAGIPFQQIYIYGENFLPLNATLVEFGIHTLVTSFYNSFTLSFTLPPPELLMKIPVARRYLVRVITIDNKSQPQPVKLVSNRIVFTVT